ncbi:hypothetical protein Tco_0296478 [Tanacetum coccineum]
MLLPKEDNVNTGKHGLGFENQNDDVNISLLNKAKELAPCLYNIDEMGKDLLSDHKIISEEELKCEAEKCLKVKQRKSPLSYHGFVYENVGITSSFEDNVKRIARNRLSGEFEPLVKNVNLQLNCFEKSLVKEMKDDLKYVMSLEDEFDETCLILDIQQEFFKTQFESAISESHSHVYENEMSEQNSSLENEKCCLKNIITELSKHVTDVKEEMTKQCAQYEKDFAKLEAHCISLKLKSKNKSSTAVQNGQVLSIKSDEAKIKFDTEDLETINIKLEYSVASLLKENEHLKRFKTCLIQSNVHEIQDSNVEKDQFLKQIASLESKLASQYLLSLQKKFSDLRTSYNAIKAKFDSLNRDKGKSPVSNFSTPKVSVSPKIYTGEYSKSFPKRVSQFTTYSFQKDRKFSKKPQVCETHTSQKVFKSSDSSRKK